jgi:hypothetical protein
LIESTLLNLPDARGSGGAASTDPLVEPMQEIDFANSVYYTEYKVQFTNDKDNAAANSMQVAEVQLLGTAAATGGAALSVTSSISGGTGTLTISSDAAGNLYSATALDGTWTLVGPISAGGNVVIDVTPSTPAAFYRVVSP